MEKYIIIMFGPSCVWKSTIANNIISVCDRIFHIKTDFLKRLISGYSPERDNVIKNALTIWLCEQAMKEWLSIIIEPHSLEWYKDLSIKYNYNYLFVYLEASYDILLERFAQRVQEYRNSGSEKYMNTDIWKFQERYKISKTLIKEDLSITCNTELIEPQEITKLIFTTLKKHMK